MSLAWLLVMARTIHFLVVIFSYLSLPPQSSCSRLDGGDRVVVPLDGGHSELPGQVLGVLAGGGKDYPLLGGGVLPYISPTTALLAAALTAVAAS